MSGEGGIAPLAFKGFMKEIFTRCRYNFSSLVPPLSRMHHNSIVELLIRISSNVVEFIVAISRAANDLRNNIINDQPSMIHFSPQTANRKV
jgi:hypothetical protein